MKTRRMRVFVPLCVFAFLMLFGHDTARADDLKDYRFSLRITKPPFKLEQGTFMHYFDGTDDYYPQVSGGFKDVEIALAIETRLSDRGAKGALGLGVIPGDVLGLTLFLEGMVNL